eukprot:TRINITY_DN18498_c0_g1_i1.p1 TRINITY_DN18498_c0_g1~~TRINITY_DN18498_c0_g1_i1.p1  ORF type:complete len:166 (-),score=18.46 TRINITY_DN18498_c0_g1_i1:149-646(-)
MREAASDVLRIYARNMTSFPFDNSFLLLMIDECAQLSLRDHSKDAMNNILAIEGGFYLLDAMMPALLRLKERPRGQQLEGREINNHQQSINNPININNDIDNNIIDYAFHELINSMVSKGHQIMCSVSSLIKGGPSDNKDDSYDMYTLLISTVARTLSLLHGCNI